MSRTTRKINHRNWNIKSEFSFLDEGPEKTCKPGCGVCGKTKVYRKQENRQRRIAGKVEINDQLT